MNPQTYILIGRSGCGKGTQAELLRQHLKNIDPKREAYHVEVGEKFREFVQLKTYTSSLSREINERGLLQPEFLAIWCWSDLFIKHMKEGEHLLVDGSPRKLHEAEVMDTALTFYRREKPTVFHLNVSRKWSMERMMARRRADDTEEDINTRLNWFEKEVMPVIDYFSKNHRYNFAEINGEQSIEKVHADILASLKI